MGGDACHAVCKPFVFCSPSGLGLSVVQPRCALVSCVKQRVARWASRVEVTRTYVLHRCFALPGLLQGKKVVLCMLVMMTRRDEHFVAGVGGPLAGWQSAAQAFFIV
jgi:hypothetical protein